MSDFNPRTPCGVRHKDQLIRVNIIAFQSTHPLRGATLDTIKNIYTVKISIHAPLAGCDLRKKMFSCAFYIFQSTHPLRGATIRLVVQYDCKEISIHAPLAGCDVFMHTLEPSQAKISIHAPLAGFDLFPKPKPLPPQAISIHAPLAGCDTAKDADSTTDKQFQSTHPLRGATWVRPSNRSEMRFQSTHPLRGATKVLIPDPDVIPISIHAPLAGCDQIRQSDLDCQAYFNPRTPCGVRQRKCTKFSAHFAITDNSIGFPRPECRLLGHFLLISGVCSARERVRTFL